MKKLILLFIVLSSCCLAMTTQYSYDSNSGLFTMNQTGEITLTVIPKGTNPGHVNEFGYFSDNIESDMHYFTNDLAGGDKTFKFTANAEDRFGFFIGIKGEPNLRRTTSLNAKDWFTFDSESSIASIEVYHSEGFGEGADKLLMISIISVIKDEPMPVGAPLPGAIATIIVGASLIKIFKVKKKFTVN